MKKERKKEWEEGRLWFEGSTIRPTGKWLSQRGEKVWSRKPKSLQSSVMQKLDLSFSPALESFMNMQAPGIYIYTMIFFLICNTKCVYIVLCLCAATTTIYVLITERCIYVYMVMIYMNRSCPFKYLFNCIWF